MGLFRKSIASEKTKWQTQDQPVVVVEVEIEVAVVDLVEGVEAEGVVDGAGVVDEVQASLKIRNGRRSPSLVVW